MPTKKNKKIKGNKTKRNKQNKLVKTKRNKANINKVNKVNINKVNKVNINKVNKVNINKVNINKVNSNKHFLSGFINKKSKNENFIVFNENNNDKIDYNNKQVDIFFQKLVEILNVAFEKEREHHIKKGSYSPGYKHDINTIKNNIHSRNFNTYVLANKKMSPISMLYVEKNEDDFDKIWTVCTDNKYRGKGMSSKLLNYMITSQLNNTNPNRNNMLLEVYNDHIIDRTENEVKQSQIMGLFGSKGFVDTDPKTLSQHSFNNLLSNDGKTKIMVFKPQQWLQKNSQEKPKLNIEAKTICS